jgi:actin related protein 2/3 complex subunit 1A/1B
MSFVNVGENVTCISCHAFNGDKTKVAFCPNNNEVHIYKKQGTEWVQEAILQEHDQIVTGLDWAPKTNRLVSCSQDRNAYVWTFEQGRWKPTLVILRINRAATQVKWSHDEKKFAVASGAKCVSICYFEEDNDWWVSKHIKKHKSTVLSVSWHPSNLLIATGSSDFKARVFSAWVKGVDERPSPTPYGDKLPFGECLAEYDSSGWVHEVAWSPSGNRLAFVGHDSSVTFVDAPSNQQRLTLSTLPFRSLTFLSENTIAAAGHDCNPAIFNASPNGWAFTKFVDEATKTAAAGGGTAMSMWQQKVDLGTTSNETTLSTKHQNAISCVQPVGGAPGRYTSFSTSAVDGKLIIWDVASLVK